MEEQVVEMVIVILIMLVLQDLVGEVVILVEYTLTEVVEEVDGILMVEKVDVEVELV